MVKPAEIITCSLSLLLSVNMQVLKSHMQEHHPCCSCQQVTNLNLGNAWATLLYRSASNYVYPYERRHSFAKTFMNYHFHQANDPCGSGNRELAMVQRDKTKGCAIITHDILGQTLVFDSASSGRHSVLV